MVTTPVILIVDDQPRNVEFLEKFLFSRGYETVKASSGKEALEKVAGNRIDLILLDVMMPGMSGFEVLEKLRADRRTRFIPVVMITGLTETGDRIKAIEAGCDDFISKPFDTCELLARVKSLVRIKAYQDKIKKYERNLAGEVVRKTEKLRRILKEKDGAYLETLYRLSQAAEYRDQETGAHISRVGHYTKIIAGRLGLKERFTEVIFHASPMHDVGKIGIPDAILLKPGKLDPGEWEIMKQHAVVGAHILKGAKVGVIKIAELVALTHHEKWDGSGYPRGLKGAAIPLVGRITAIADVFDALISRRLYKEALPLGKAFDIIREGEGRHFDPGVVKTFLSCRDDIVAITERYKNKVNA